MSRCLVPLRQHAGPPVVVRVEALELLMRLERDGFRFRTTDTGRLEVAPWPKVSEADRAALREYHDDAVLVVTLEPPRL